MVMVPTGLATAWHNSGEFWVQTGMAVARHPLVVLVYAAVPAAERAYLLLETRPIPAWKQSLLEGLVTLWRVLLCVGTVWVAVSAEKWQSLCSFAFPRAVRCSLPCSGWATVPGASFPRGAVGTGVVCSCVSFTELCAGAELRDCCRRLFRRRDRRKALVSVLRNLVLVPLALIYLVVLLQQKFY